MIERCGDCGYPRGTHAPTCATKNAGESIAPSPPGTWSDAMTATLREKYATARDAGMLPELAAELNVGLYQLYAKAHRLGLAKQIRRR